MKCFFVAWHRAAILRRTRAGLWEALRPRPPCRGGDSNSRPCAYESNALSLDHRHHLFFYNIPNIFAMPNFVRVFEEPCRFLGKLFWFNHHSVAFIRLLKTLILSMIIDMRGNIHNIFSGTLPTRFCQHSFTGRKIHLPLVDVTPCKICRNSKTNFS